MTSQEAYSLLKSCARRSFSFTCCNLQAFATHPHSLGDPLLGRDPWFEKHCCRATFQKSKSERSKVKFNYYALSNNRNCQWK